MSTLRKLLKFEKETLPLSRPARFLLLALFFALAILAVNTAAQEETPAADDLPPGVTVADRVVTPNSVTTILNIETIKDTFVSSNFPDTNYGSFGQLRTGYDAPPSSTTNYGAQRSLMQFNVYPGLVPAGAIVENATFYIYQEGATGSANLEIEARRLASSWDESSVTWNSHQPVWGDALGRGTADAANGWKTVDATNIVKEWLSGAPNYGVVFQTDETPANQNQRVYRSRETNEKPYIILTYTEYNDNCAPSANIAPLNAWSPGVFTVSWSGSDCGSPGYPPSGVDRYDVQYSTDNYNWIDWKTNAPASETSDAFNGVNGVTYYFRVRATDKAGNTGVYSTSQSTRVDAVAPSASMGTINKYNFPSFTVTWSGSDNLSGVASYEVQFREAGGQWFSQSYPASQTSDVVTGGEPGKTYGFRVRAIDNAGNASAFTTEQTTTIVNDPTSIIAPFDPPIVLTQTVTVSWVPYTTGTINSYTIKYRYNGGAWKTWKTVTGTPPATSDTFDAAIDPDWSAASYKTGLFEFEVAATTTNLGSEPFTGVPEASVVIDPDGNMKVQAYLPVVFQP